MLTRTLWGWGWLLQAAATALTAAAWWRVQAREAEPGGTGWWWGAAAGALLLALTPALSGHAAAVPRLTLPAVLADLLHVLGAGAWLGSLLLLLGVGLPAARRLAPGRRAPALAALVGAFSPVALACAAVVVATGVFGTGAYNWLRVRPRLREETGARRLRRSGWAELAIGALVLAVTAVLVATPPPAP